MNILFIESDQAAEYNCSNWRCVVPMRALRRAGHKSNSLRLEEWNQGTARANKFSQEADLIFVQRNLFNETLDTVFYWAAKGKKLIADVDDSYKDMTEDTGSPSFKFWKKGLMDGNDGKEYRVSPTPLDMLKYGVKLCKGLSSPSKLICKDWEGITKTYWFPNYLDLSLYYRKEIYHVPGTVNLGWGGSMTHLVSWEKSGAAAAVSQIINEKPNVNIVLLGDPRCERFFKVKPKNRLTQGWLPQPTFAGGLSAFDIGLIPLYGEYDRRRSWIKTAEFSVMGIPWIGTDAEPTQDINTGLRVKNTPEDWYNALKFYIENIEVMQDVASKNMEAAKEQFDIDRHVGTLVELFARIIQEAK